MNPDFIMTDKIITVLVAIGFAVLVVALAVGPIGYRDDAVVVAGEGYVVMEEGVPGQEYIETEEGTTIIVMARGSDE